LEPYIKRYSAEIKALAPTIREVAEYVPSRRRRKLHIGLFGYSREVNGSALPRAIKFTASLYSLGIPPEILGLSALSEKDIEAISDVYKGIYEDLSFAFSYFNPNSIEKFKFLKDVLKISHLFEFEKNEEHFEITSKILSGEINEELILKAASIRGFLG